MAASMVFSCGFKHINILGMEVVCSVHLLGDIQNEDIFVENAYKQTNAIMAHKSDKSQIQENI